MLRDTRKYMYSFFKKSAKIKRGRHVPEKIDPGSLKHNKFKFF